MFKHQRIPITNELTPNCNADFDGYHVSFNPRSAGYGCSQTTAIVMQNHVFFVLNGDHKDELLSASKNGGLAGCIQYFIQHIDQANKRSEHHIVVGNSKDPFGVAGVAMSYMGSFLIDQLREAAKAHEKQSA